MSSDRDAPGDVVDFSADAVRAVVVLTERPPAPVLMEVHRTLGLGVMEIRHRIDAGQPLVDRELFRNDRLVLSALLRTVLELVGPYLHSVHECLGSEAPGDGNRISDDQMLRLIADDTPEPEFPRRPVPDPELTEALSRATRAALAELSDGMRSNLCTVSLVTTGEALRPYLSVTAHGPDRWNNADGARVGTGDDHFLAAAQVWDARGDLLDLCGSAAADEFTVRLASMEEALRRLDTAGFFTDREGLLLLVETVPPDPVSAGYARRLNPTGPLLGEWLEEVSECPVLSPDPVTSAEAAEWAGPSEPAPNPAVAELWRMTPGLYLDNAWSFHGPHSLAERNTTYEVARYCPGWALVGDDGGGRGFLMRRAGVGPGAETTGRTGFDPARGRELAEVFRLDLGALDEAVEREGTFVTDDLCGWLAAVSGTVPGPWSTGRAGPRPAGGAQA